MKIAYKKVIFYLFLVIVLFFLSGSYERIAVAAGVGTDEESFADRYSDEKEEVIITKQPISDSAFLGEKVSVSVEATGYLLKYNWYYRDVKDTGFRKSSIVGNTYTLTMDENRANREVYCVVTDGHGNKAVSDTVQLRLAVKEELEIVKQPVPDDAAPGESATVFVEAKGDALKYTWYYRDAGIKNFTKSTLTGSTYTVTVTEKNANRELYCVIRDVHGNQVKTDTVNLIHVEPLAITKQPVSDSAFLGEKVSVSVEATGYPLKYNWYYRDVRDTGFRKSSIVGNTYTLTMEENRANREVYCVVTDAYGNKAVSDTVKLCLTVIEELEIVKQPVPDDAAPGESATVFVEAKGDAPEYTWYYRDAGIKNFTKSTLTGSTYTVTVTEKNANRELYCVIRDVHGNQVMTDTVNLIHVEPLAITKQPVSDSAFLGEKVSVSVEATGYPLKYSWYYRDVRDTGFRKSSIVGNTYTLTMEENKANREVYCVVTDAYGNKVTSDVVELKAKEKQEDVKYYGSIKDALHGVSEKKDEFEAAVAVKIIENKLNVILLRDIELTETVSVNEDIILHLNGYTIRTSVTEAIRIEADVVIDGSKPGSGMQVSALSGESVNAISVRNGGSLTANGGVYYVQTTDAGTGSNPVTFITAETGTLVKVNHATIEVTDNCNGVVVGILNKTGSELYVTDSFIRVSTGESLANAAVYAVGDATLTDCTLIGEADYTANAAETSYASNSNGVFAESNLEMTRCYVWGAHAGVKALGNVVINGGTYEGYGHGGIYCGGIGTTSYVYDASVNWTEMREGTIADSIAGTNGAGMYIGGGKNISVYMDNCNIYGTLYGVVLRSSGGEANNNLFVSNSTFAGCSRYAYRIGNTSSPVSLKVYAGNGNTYPITGEIYNYISRVEETSELYRK